MADAPAVEFSSEITELADKLVNLTVKDAQSLVDCMKDVHGIEPAGWRSGHGRWRRWRRGSRRREDSL